MSDYCSACEETVERLWATTDDCTKMFNFLCAVHRVRYGHNTYAKEKRELERPIIIQNNWARRK
jgi:hypothetical protein